MKTVIVSAPLADFIDGYIWLSPVDDMKMVELIPLTEYSPADAALPERRADWQKRADDLANGDGDPLIVCRVPAES